MSRHPRCGAEWRGPFGTDDGPVMICNACGDVADGGSDVPDHPTAAASRRPDHLERRPAVTDAAARR